MTSASYYIDVAWGHSLAGHPDDAVSTLLTAENLFPDAVRCRPFAIDPLDGLRRSASGTRARELEQLAARAGLPVWRTPPTPDPVLLDACEMIHHEQAGVRRQAQRAR